MSCSIIFVLFVVMLFSEFRLVRGNIDSVQIYSSNRFVDLEKEIDELKRKIEELEQIKTKEV